MFLRRLAGFLLLALGGLAMLAPVALLEHWGYVTHIGRVHDARHHATTAMRAATLWPVALAWMLAYLGAGCAIGFMLGGIGRAQSEPQAD